MADGDAPGGTPEQVILDRSALARVLAHVDEAIVACSADGTITFASESVRQLLGYDAQSAVGRNVSEFMHPDELVELLESIERWADRAGQPRGQVQRLRAIDGSWVDVHYDVVSGAAARPLGDLVLTLRPAPEGEDRRLELLDLIRQEDRIVRLASRFAAVDADGFDEALGDAIAELSGLAWVTRLSIWLADGPRVRLRKAWTAQATAPRNELPDATRIEGSWILRRVASLEEVHVRSVAHLPDDCEERDVLRSWGVRSLLAVPMMRSGRFYGLILAESTFANAILSAAHATVLRAASSILAGAFARNEAEVALAHRARTDALTELPNRWAFVDALVERLDDVRRRLRRGVGMALVDLDRFKLVNDALGHAAGDRLLREVAQRLTSAATDDQVVARLGGDELMVLDPSARSLDEMLRTTSRLVETLKPPFEIQGHPVTLTASAGVVFAERSPSSGQQPDAEELMRRADLAMHRAKARGGDHIEVDDEAMRWQVTERLRREGELRQAVEGDGLLVHYQAEWDLVRDAVIGAEALARWDHPVDGVVTAGTFISMAEECGLIVPLGARVLDEAVRSLVGWASAPAGDFVLRINVSAIQLHRDGIVERLGSVLRTSGVRPERLCLELTESTLLADPERSVAVLESLRELGVGLALDDFGTGFSSMLYLKRLPITSIKIDQTFVAGLPRDDRDRAIVGSTVELADSLGVSVTAEGVEQVEQREALVELGCTRAQGFLLSKPEPASALAARLQP